MSNWTLRACSGILEPQRCAWKICNIKLMRVSTISMVSLIRKPSTKSIKNPPKITSSIVKGGNLEAGPGFIALLGWVFFIWSTRISKPKEIFAFKPPTNPVGGIGRCVGEHLRGVGRCMYVCCVVLCCVFLFFFFEEGYHQHVDFVFLRLVNKIEIVMDIYLI